MQYTQFTKSRPVYLCAKYVDELDIGNKDGKINTNAERNVFKNIIKGAFDYDFDFTGDIQTQANILNARFNGNEKGKCKEGRAFFDSCNKLYVGSTNGCTSYRSDIWVVGDNCGKSAGTTIADCLIRKTNKTETENVNKMLERLFTDYGSSELNNKIITNFIKGYYEQKGIFNSGMFEQFATEADSSKITNKQAAELLKKIKDAVPEEKRQGKDWTRICEAQEKYENKNPEELFRNEQKHFSRLLWFANDIDNIDDSIERLFLVD